MPDAIAVRPLPLVPPAGRDQGEGAGVRASELRGRGVVAVATKVHRFFAANLPRRSIVSRTKGAGAMSDEVREQQARVWARQRREAGMPEDDIREELSRRGFSDPWIDAVMAEPLPERVEGRRVPAPGGGCGTGVVFWIVLALGCLGMIALAAFVVIGITAPVFMRAREKATTTSCMSNLKQLATAQLMYASDYDETLPDAGTWIDAQMPYLMNESIYLCPEDPAPFMPGTFPVSYGMNVALSGQDLRKLANPALTPSLLDATAPVGDQTIGAFRHNDGANVGFADGHVKWIAQSDWSATWAAAAPSAGTPAGSGATSPPPSSAAPSPAPEAGSQQPAAEPAPEDVSEAYVHARENARRSACNSNLRQLATAQLMYATDYDERMQPAATWPQATEPYVRNLDLFICPSDRPGSMQSPWPLSYGMNDALTGRQLGDIAVPAEVPSLMDATAIAGDPARMVEFRHEGAAVVSFVDGHVMALEEPDWRTRWPAEADGGG